MKRYEELVQKACQCGAVTHKEAIALSALFPYIQQVFNEGGKEATKAFKERFGEVAHDTFLVMTSGRRY